MKKILRAAAATLLGLSLTTGIAAAQTTGTVTTSGPDSHATVHANTHTRQKVTNNNDLSVSSWKGQHASTGSVGVWHNTTAGAARTGNARNSTTFSVSANVDNSSSTTAIPLSTTSNNVGNVTTSGPDSRANVTANTHNTVKVKNNNDISIDTDSWQSAESGRASVAGNTTGGSATSGNASNTSTTNVNLNVTN